MLTAERDVYLYRRKYGMPRNDPRLADLTLEDVQLDLEIEPAIRAAEHGVDPKECFDCGVATYRAFCPLCTGPIYASREEWAAEKLAERQAESGKPMEHDEWSRELDKLLGDGVSQDGSTPTGMGR